MKTPKHITIVGGGISGLVTAYYIQQQFGEKVAYTVVEKTAVFGGKIATTRLATAQDDDFIIEGGPESFVTRKREAYDLCLELGLKDRMIGTSGSGKNYVLQNGRPEAVPMGPIPFLRTPLLSGKGKMRLLKEPFTPPRTDPSDETLGDFISRRLGREALENLVAPAVGSIYLADADALSTAVSFGRFAELEREYGSIVKGMFGSMKAKKAARKAAGEPKPTKAEKLPPFMTLRSGLVEMVEGLASKLNGELLLETAVSSIKTADNGRYQLQLNNGQTLNSDAVVLAVPTYAMADLIAPHDNAIAEQLRAVRYNAVATVTLAFNASDVAEPFDGFGVVVPKAENIPLLACEGMSVKFSHRNPADQIVLRGFVGGKGFTDGKLNESLIDLPDDELITLVRKQLENIFNISAPPTVSKIYRWQPATPQYAVGHLEMITAVEQQLATTMPNLHLTGSGTRGMGIPDCIRVAKDTVDQLKL